MDTVSSSSKTNDGNEFDKVFDGGVTRSSSEVKETADDLDRLLPTGTGSSHTRPCRVTGRRPVWGLASRFSCLMRMIIATISIQPPPSCEPSHRPPPRQGPCDAISQKKKNEGGKRKKKNAAGNPATVAPNEPPNMWRHVALQIVVTGAPCAVWPKRFAMKRDGDKKA